MSETLPNAENDFDDDPPATFSFVIRVWKEKINYGNHETWRGHITSIIGNERSYFSNLTQISTLIAAYLKSHQ